ncbi:MAG: FMN-binding protein [Treponema sp.]|nr:FMN-binding protein [Treponema sp.]
MTRKFFVSAVTAIAVSVLLSACIVEYNFDRAPPWTGLNNQPVTASNATGTGTGWLNGTITVTLDLVQGEIRNVRIDAQRDTPSHTRDLIQSAPRNAEIFNSFEFLNAMTGATVTRNGIRQAGENALMNAGADF